MFTSCFMKKNEKTNLQDIILVQMYEMVKIQMCFHSNYLMFVKFLCIDV
jgi:hypothetical protein